MSICKAVPHLRQNRLSGFHCDDGDQFSPVTRTFITSVKLSSSPLAFGLPGCGSALRNRRMLPLTLLIKEDGASARPRGPGLGTLGRDGGDCDVRAPGDPTDSDDSLEAEPRRLVGDIKLAIRPRRGVGVPRTTSEPCRGDFGDWLALLLVVTRSLSRFANLTASLQQNPSAEAECDRQHGKRETVIAITSSSACTAMRRRFDWPVRDSG